MKLPEQVINKVLAEVKQQLESQNPPKEIALKIGEAPALMPVHPGQMPEPDADSMPGGASDADGDEGQIPDAVRAAIAAEVAKQLKAAKGA